MNVSFGVPPEVGWAISARSTAVVPTVTASVTVWLRETICDSLVSPRMIIILLDSELEL